MKTLVCPCGARWKIVPGAGDVAAACPVCIESGRVHGHVGAGVASSGVLKLAAQETTNGYLQVIGDTLAFTFPGDVTLAVTLPAGAGDDVAADTIIGEHLRKDLTQLFGYAVDLGNRMVACVDKEDVCVINKAVKQVVYDTAETPVRFQVESVTEHTVKLCKPAGCDC